MLIRTLTVLTFVSITTTGLRAADSPLVGKWKADISKSDLTGTSIKIEQTGQTFRVSFGSDTDTYFADGTEHPSKYGNQRTITEEGKNKWTVVSRRDGKVVTSYTWVVSDDGKTMTRSYQDTRPDGTTDKMVYTDKRTGGTTGFAGTWVTSDAKVSGTVEMEIRPLEGDGLSILTPAYQEQDDITFDGKELPNKGPRVAAGSTTSGKRIDEHTIELTNRVKGEQIDVQRVEASADGKTLTSTDTYAGDKKPIIVVFERQ